MYVIFQEKTLKVNKITKISYKKKLSFKVEIKMWKKAKTNKMDGVSSQIVILAEGLL